MYLMKLKEVRAEARLQLSLPCKSRFTYINFTKEFTYDLSNHPLADTVYLVYGDGRLQIFSSDYAKQFLAKKKEYELKRMKQTRRRANNGHQ